jgi:signal transduction histidine kinase
MITFAALAAVLAAPLAGLVFFLLFESRFADGDIATLPVAGFWAAFAFATLVYAAAVGAVFVRTLNRPIGRLVQRTEAIARGDRDAIRPLAHHGTRELAALTESFLAMAERLSDRSDYIATFAAHVSHELKSPLTSIKGAAELLKDESATMTAEERERFLANIVADAGRLTRLVERLRDLARADNPQRDGACTLSEIADAMTAKFPNLAVRATGALDRPAAISGENARIVFANLLENARGHGAKTVAIAASVEDDALVVVVSDDGAGVSEANRDKIFELFFTTRREEGGAGMGLAIVAAMLRAHGGAIRLLRPAKGAAFELRVPLASV